jgi:hypothetical protein
MISGDGWTGPERKCLYYRCNMQARDWEKQVCEHIDNIISDPDDAFEHTEELLDFIEDLLSIAYIKGKQSGETK